RGASVAGHWPAAEAWRLAGIWDKLLDCAAMGRRAVGGPFQSMLGTGSIAHRLVIARPGPSQYTDRQPRPMDSCSRENPGSSTQGGNMNIRETAPRFTELEKIST